LGILLVGSGAFPMHEFAAASFLWIKGMYTSSDCFAFCNCIIYKIIFKANFGFKAKPYSISIYFGVSAFVLPVFGDKTSPHFTACLYFS